MRHEAADAGFYDSPWGSSHPRLQILTIEELLGGSRIDYPRTNANSTFKKADKYSDAPVENLEFKFDSQTNEEIDTES